MTGIKVQAQEIVGWIDSRLASLGEDAASTQKAMWQALRKKYAAVPSTVHELSVDDFQRLHHGEPETEPEPAPEASPSLPNPVTPEEDPLAGREPSEIEKILAPAPAAADVSAK